MFDNLNYVQQGQSYQPSAGAHNAFVDTARRVRNLRQWTAAEPTRWDQGISPFIVTEKQSNKAYGIGQNTYITSHFAAGQDASNNINQRSFRAKPYEVKTNTVKALEDLEGDEVFVFATMIPTVIFTGQLIFVASVKEPFERSGTAAGDEPVGDVISGARGSRYTGTVTTQLRTGLQANECYVDVNFLPLFENETAELSRQQTCRVRATNATGTELANGQRVILDCLPFAGATVMWRVAEYECLPVFVTGT